MSDSHFSPERYEEYFGDATEVKTSIYQCKYCKSKLVFNHFSNYKNLYIKETSQCTICEKHIKKKLHILN